MFLRRATALSIVVVVVMAWGVVTSSATVDAQELDCKDVPYNERIIVVCTSTDGDTTDSPNSDTSSTDNDDDDDDDDGNPDADDPDADDPDADDTDADETDEDDTDSEDGEESDAADDAVEVRDRGTRGSRGAGADADLGPLLASNDGDAGETESAVADDAASDLEDLTEPSREPEEPEEPEEAAVTDPGASEATERDAEKARAVTTGGSFSSNLPIIIGIAAPAAVGGALMLAARRL